MIYFETDSEAEFRQRRADATEARGELEATTRTTNSFSKQFQLKIFISYSIVVYMTSMDIYIACAGKRCKHDGYIAQW